MNLATHLRKRIEIIVEAPALNQVLDALNGAEVSGYTVLPALQGKGNHGVWSLDDSLNSASNMVCVICVTNEQKADAAVESIYAVVKRQIAIVSVSDVKVLRPGHF